MAGLVCLADGRVLVILGTFGTRVAIGASLFNYTLFFGADIAAMVRFEVGSLS